MELLAVLIPVLMLGIVLALGRYEEMLLPAEKEATRLAPPPALPTSPSSPAPAGTPAPSP
ncbi:hypothetical protein ACFYWX_00830 [Streptomyces sp. NPDC002888]|uniref:hypothetical protein n=1 Tax=Streptomyces sp. NPDC002888 TaxID=3364668 RepID=UPI003679753F